MNNDLVYLLDWMGSLAAAPSYDGYEEFRMPSIIYLIGEMQLHCAFLFFSCILPALQPVPAHDCSIKIVIKTHTIIIKT